MSNPPTPRTMDLAHPSPYARAPSKPRDSSYEMRYIAGQGAVPASEPLYDRVNADELRPETREIYADLKLMPKRSPDRRPVHYDEALPPAHPSDEYMVVDVSEPSTSGDENYSGVSKSAKHVYDVVEDPAGHYDRAFDTLK